MRHNFSLSFFVFFPFQIQDRNQSISMVTEDSRLYKCFNKASKENLSKIFKDILTSLALFFVSQEDHPMKYIPKFQSLQKHILFHIQ